MFLLGCDFIFFNYYVGWGVAGVGEKPTSELPFGLSYCVSSYPSGQETSAGLLPTTKCIHSNRIVGDWKNNYQMDMRTQ